MITDKNIKICDRRIEIEYSKRAQGKIASLNNETNLEMELNFSCLVKKTVFEATEKNRDLFTKLSPFLYLSFRAITTNVCVPQHINKYDHEAVKILEIVKPERFIPDWVFIDFKNEKWGGEFGYVSNDRVLIT